MTGEKLLLNQRVALEIHSQPTWVIILTFILFSKHKTSILCVCVELWKPQAKFGSSPPCCHWWPPQHLLLCEYRDRPARAFGLEQIAGYTVDTGSCLSARWMGTDCGLHPPTPPPSACHHPELGHASLGGERQEGRLTPVCAANEDVMKSGKEVEEQRLAPAYDKPSEPGGSERCSSAEQAGPNVQQCSSTFLKGFAPGSFIARLERANTLQRKS